MTYKEYLRSADWDLRRRAELLRANYRCERCGDDNAELHVHHKTYKHLFHERAGELEVLCKSCHRTEHGIRDDATLIDMLQKMFEKLS